jgi:hypothetical protein
MLFCILDFMYIYFTSILNTIPGPKQFVWFCVLKIMWQKYKADTQFIIFTSQAVVSYSSVHTVLYEGASVNWSQMEVKLP